MTNLFACILMAAVSLPVSFYLAKQFLRGVVRIVTGTERRDML
jgi:hypothetical protein